MGWHMVFKALYRELGAWNNGDAALAIIPERTEATESEAGAGLSYRVRVRLQSADGTVLRWAKFTLAASIGDTTTPTPTIDDATPTLVNGEAVITVTLPEGTYNADEDVTVTISNFTAPDGRQLTGGTAVLTIVADPEPEEE